jgi:hypothetical protein
MLGGGGLPGWEDKEPERCLPVGLVVCGREIPRRKSRRKWCNVMILVNCLSVWRVGGVWDVDDVGEVNGVWKIGYVLMEDGFCGNRQ